MPERRGGVQDYYSYLSDNDKCNLKYTQELFKENFIVPKTRYIPIILLETKVDLFKKMIEEGSPPMRECYPDFKGPDGDFESASAFLRNKIKRRVRENLHSRMLEMKLDNMPVMRQNLTSKRNFRVSFNHIWDKVILAMKEMEEVDKFLQRNSHNLGRKSSVQEFMSIKKRAVMDHRKSVTDLGPGTGTGAFKSPTRKLKFSATSNFRRSISVLTGQPLFPRGSGAASIEELISGTNSLQLKKSSRKESVQGIIRSKSYH